MHGDTKQRVIEALEREGFRTVYGELVDGRSPNANGWINCRCPFHEDRSPSFGIHLETGRWKCQASCGHGDAFDFHAREQGLSGFGPALRSLASLLGIATDSRAPSERKPSRREQHTRPLERGNDDTTFTADDAQRIWSAAREAVKASPGSSARRLTMDFLFERGLVASADRDLFGVVTDDIARLHTSLASWPRQAHHLVTPLHDIDTAEVVNLQSRCVAPNARGPKTLFPKGGRAAGTVFADPRGLAVLRGDDTDSPVVLGEGLTDFLALAITSSAPVLAVPGVSMVTGAIGSWAKDRQTYLLLDNDDAGERHVIPAVDAIEAMGGEAVRLEWAPGVKDTCDALALAGEELLSEFLKRRIA